MKRRREPKRPGALGRITWMLTAGFLALWLGCMGCVTVAVAIPFRDIFREDFARYTDVVDRLGLMGHVTGEERDNPRWEESWESGAMDNAMIQSTRSRFVTVGISGPGRNFDFGYDLRLEGLGLLRGGAEYQTAVIYCDPEGNILRESGDYLTVQYQTEEEWQERGSSHAGSHYAWIDISDREDPRYAILWKAIEENGGTLGPMRYRDTRITGYLNGTQLEPVKFEYRMHFSNDDTWHVEFDVSDTVQEPEKLVTIYGMYVDFITYEPGGAVWYRDKKHENLLSLLRSELARDNAENFLYGRKTEWDLLNIVHLDAREYWNTGGEEPKLEFFAYAAIQASPLLGAMKSLWYVYLVTFLLGLICLLVIRSRIRDNLIAPIREVSGARQRDWAVINFDNDPPRWQEAWEIQNHYVDSREYRRMKGNEVKRLETALEYVRTAEEHRRQMTSNIAHELKTPLAVVHSYAEGLQEHIAEEKREKYLETILAETERMDTMVLEMLDLSRLEAGKVKLARDDFDLVELAKSVFDTLSIKAAEKGLRVTLNLPEKAMLAADEGRIRQVVENFASNAVKYTPEGGTVAARIFREGGKTVFSVENESRPLSDEALEKVWDTFWRADESRTGGVGTGLGLAIARSIVELHGGKVGVQNTVTGVEFRFAI
ncbi:MAG: HAMP domain-containing histidine kinase [Ruminococcaceae bacterium]|nr:HAMP domain-containing histidine kinase [Oscillospiraceae bacterium]